jgi:putative heme-binding domain-containing protein
MLRAPGKQWQRFELAVPTGNRDLRLIATWSTDEDPRPRAFPLRRFLVPWAQPAEAFEKSSSPSERTVPEIAGGNWLHGKRLFFGNKFACGRCHVIRGEGAVVGPELSNLIHRDYASVLKDIQFPNAALNPDHIASIIELNDGESMSGIIVSDKANEIKVAMASGLSEVLPRARVKSIQPAQLSLMPEGLWDAMGADERRDLMTFLLTVPLESYAADPVIQGHKQPEPRRRAEFEKLVPPLFSPHQHDDKAEADKPIASFAPLTIVLCAAAKDPGHNFPGMHDYPIWRERWSKLLALADNVKVETADRWPSAEQWKRADVIAVSSDNPAWSTEKANDLDAFLARGGGLIFLHFAVNGGKDADALTKRIGFGWGSGAKFRHGAEEVVLAEHEITSGLPESISFEDETYWNLKTSGDATVLGTVIEEGVPRPQIWIREQGGGRVFCSILGHFTWTFDDPLYRALLLRGMAWSAHQPIDRFNELVTIGARVRE